MISEQDDNNLIKTRHYLLQQKEVVVQNINYCLSSKTYFAYIKVRFVFVDGVNIDVTISFKEKVTAQCEFTCVQSLIKDVAKSAQKYNNFLKQYKEFCKREGIEFIDFEEWLNKAV